MEAERGMGRGKSGADRPTSAALTELGRVGHLMVAAVTTPSVPSAPMNRCLRSYPVLSLSNGFRLSMILPSART